MDNNTVQKESLNAQDHQQKADGKSIIISTKTAINIIVIIALAVLVYFCKGLLIAATVNGSPISRLAVIQELEKTSGKNLLDSLITEKLIQNEADAKKITVSSEEIAGEIKKIEDQIVAQGSTIDKELVAQGMSMDDLKKQVMLQKEVEKLVADKINVTDEEVAQYIKDNAISIPEGQETTNVAQIKNQLKSQKLNTEGSSLIATLKAQAKVNYFVNY
jgi:foldase protein PrsA